MKINVDFATLLPRQFGRPRRYRTGPRLRGGGIAGVIIGGIVFLLLCAVILYCLCFRKRRAARRNNQRHGAPVAAPMGHAGHAGGGGLAGGFLSKFTKGRQQPQYGPGMQEAGYGGYNNNPGFNNNPGYNNGGYNYGPGQNQHAGHTNFTGAPINEPTPTYR